ncbi:MAG: hypothetical protein DWQ02_03250 [Bacteroidetes bacterium]|nr:MAG: hypothetical protein DWQ02_03250 [Bacteroidota bacterium]
MQLLKILPLLLLITSCSKQLGLYQSYSESDFSPETSVFNHDETNDLYWLVTNDSDHLYLRIHSSKMTTQMKMLNAGFTVYLDPTGEKSESTFLNFPVRRERRRMDRENTGRRPSGAPGGGERPKFDVNRVIERIDSSAVFVLEGTKETFNYKANDSGIEIAVFEGEEGVFHYFSVIPFNKISPEGEKAISKLSIGLVSGAFEIPVNTGGGMEQRAGNRPGGGQRMAEMQKRRAEMAEPIKIWGLIELKKQ